MLMETVAAISLLAAPGESPPAVDRHVHPRPATSTQTATPEDALLEAARQGDRARVEALLDDGIDVDSRNRYDATPLFFAADRGYLALVELLVERGATLDIEDSFYRTSPLRRALGAGHLAVVRYLLERGAAGADAALLAAVRERERALLETAIASGGFYAEDVEAACDLAREMGATAFVDRLGAVDAPAKPTTRVDADALQRYVGTYQNDALGQIVEIAPVADGLAARLGDDAPFVLRPTGTSSFAASERDDLELAFGGRGGMVEYLVLTRDRVATRFRPIDESESREAAPVGPGDTLSAAPLRAGERLPAQPWPSFRGRNASGVADGQGAPLEWDEATGANIQWKTPIPGFATSGPIIWGDRVFITTAVGQADDDTFRTGLYGDTTPVDDLSEHSWRVYALDKPTGEILWERVAHLGIPGTKRHTKSSQANSTPVTDGRRLVVLFGSVGVLYCYDLDGTLLWKRDLGVLNSSWFLDPDYQWGHASSPILYEDLVIVQADTQTSSFISAYSLETGEEVWRTARDEEVSTFSTPTIYRGPTGDELVTNGTQIRGYDPRTGEILWFLGPNSEIPIATPVVTDELIFVTAGYPPIRPIYAIRPGRRGDVSLPEGADASADIVWSQDRGGSYIPSPIIYEGYLYLAANNGRLTCYDAETGERIYRARIGGVGGSYAASPIAADGKLYFTSEEGESFVVKSGPTYELLARNQVDGIVMTDPAVSDGLMVIRTLKHVYGIGQ